MDDRTQEISNLETDTAEKSKKGKKKGSQPLKTSELIKIMHRTIKIQTAWLITLSVVVTVLLGCVFSDALTYGCAKLLIGIGSVESGFSMLKKIPDYEPSAALLDEYKYKITGNVVELGTYEQDGVRGNGKEALQWVVLEYDKEAQKALLITKFSIDCVVYQDNYGGVTWETSDMREWLNQKFFEDAFDRDELKIIAESCIETPNNLKYDTKGGRETVDKIFLLSDEEFGKYLKETEYAVGYTTQYARESGVRSDPVSGAGTWWLRSSGESLVYVSAVDSLGELNSEGVYAYNYSSGVRPAMWINVED